MFDICDNEILFDRTVIAKFSVKIWPTLRDQVEEALLAYDPSGADEASAKEIRELEAEHDTAARDLEARISELEAERDALEKTLETIDEIGSGATISDLRDQIARSETAFHAAQDSAVMWRDKYNECRSAPAKTRRKR